MQMSAIVTFNELGYLPSGFHDKEPSEIKSVFVDNFPNSSSRKEIFEGYSKFCKTLVTLGIKNFVQWLDGSFCTSKENPNDIDVVTFVNYDKLNALTSDNQDCLMNLAQNPTSKVRYKCDSYVVLVYPQTHQYYRNYLDYRMYWRGVWGFDRNDNPKGIIRVTYGEGVGYV